MIHRVIDAVRSLVQRADATPEEQELRSRADRVAEEAKRMAARRRRGDGLRADYQRAGRRLTR